MFTDRSLFETCRVETRSFLKGIDVNRLPAMAVDMEEEEAGVSSPNSTISSSVSGKRRSLERSELGNSDDIIDCDDEDGDNSRKKLRLSKDQAAILEDSFKEHNTLNPVSVFIASYVHIFSVEVMLMFVYGVRVSW